MAMSSVNRVKLARYHNRRGVLMLKCARGVELSTHREAFKAMAEQCFEAARYNCTLARISRWQV